MKTLTIKTTRVMTDEEYNKYKAQYPIVKDFATLEETGKDTVVDGKPTENMTVEVFLEARK